MTWKAPPSERVPSFEGESVAQSCLTLQPLGLRPARLLCLWDSPGRNLEWVAIPYSRGASQPRDQTQISRIAGGFFTI